MLGAGPYYGVFVDILQGKIRKRSENFVLMYVCASVLKIFLRIFVLLVSHFLAMLGVAWWAQQWLHLSVGGSEQ